MSGEANSDLSFENQGPWSSYSAPYVDNLGNEWRFDLAGPKSLVDRLAAAPPIFLQAKPLDAPPAGRPDPNKVDASPVVGIPEDLTRRPALTLDFVLVRLADAARPFQVNLRVDPIITKGAHWYGFRLFGSDTTASVSYTANGGTVTLSLLGATFRRSGPAAAGDVSSASPRNMHWQVVVSWASGTPDYSLSGDITLFP